MQIKKSTRKHKKYMARRSCMYPWVHFGDKRYQQYKDSTGLGLYSHLDHGDKRRRENYFQRFSDTPYKSEALKKEQKYSAKWLSHKYLW